ncbi:hypothetical protein SCP_0409730 [Sparassis crispa]|nr:hypothetical protein SCP_0409730 [Sparassis crispa]GBE82589.1 hypothetical protein SCP_0409730 [Sparassis crispa]
MQTEEEVEMELALKHPDRQNPDIGQAVRVIKGPLKGFVGTLRNVTYHGDYEVELEAKLLTSRGVLLFQKPEIAFRSEERGNIDTAKHGPLPEQPRTSLGHELEPASHDTDSAWAYLVELNGPDGSMSLVEPNAGQLRDKLMTTVKGASPVDGKVRCEYWTRKLEYADVSLQDLVILRPGPGDYAIMCKHGPNFGAYGKTMRGMADPLVLVLEEGSRTLRVDRDDLAQLVCK